MGLWKQLTGGVKTVVGGTLAAIVIRAIASTIRWECVNCSGLTPHDKEQPGIFVFWHGRMLMLPMGYFRVRGKRVHLPYMLISQHGDGRLIAFAVRLLGIRSIAGSSPRGGSRATRSRRSRRSRRYSTDRRWQLGSWDGMIIPKPFSRGVVVFGSPVHADPRENSDQLRLKIQDALLLTTEKADGHWTSV